MSENKSAYKTIFKATSIFGTMHFLNMVIAVVRSKFLAILIGPEGYGIFSLLNSTIDIVKQAVGFGIETSGVKKIAEANSLNDNEQLLKNSAILIKIGLITGLVGTIVAVIFSGWLSIWTFGDETRAGAIVWIAMTILIKQLTGAQGAVIQGMSKLNFLAKSNLYGNLFGLLLTLPLYFFFGIDAIVPAIIVSSIINYLFSLLYYKKLNLGLSYQFSLSGLKEGKDVIFFGGLLAIGSFLSVLSNYLIQVFIRYMGDISTVGIFSVGIIMINAYVGIIFIAMTTEYYPRLSAISHNVKLENEAFNQQAVISVLLIVPIIIIFLFFKEIIVSLLFSKDFLAVLPMLSWAVLAMLFKSISWSLGYIIIARADSKVFVKTAVFYNCLYLGLCIGGYYLDGLNGLGIGFCIYFILHLVCNYFITHYRYGIKLDKALIQVFSVGIVVCIMAFLCSDIDNTYLKYGIFIIIFLFTVFYCYKEIDKRIGMRDIFAKFINRNK